MIAVKLWLVRPENTHWLIICDNYDNPEFYRSSDPAAVDIRQFLPEAGHRSVIFITRSRLEIGYFIHVGELDMYDGLLILSDASHRKGVLIVRIFTPIDTELILLQILLQILLLPSLPECYMDTH